MPANPERPGVAFPLPNEAGGILAIDLGRIVENWRDLTRRVAPAQCAAVVKADAYGCGIEAVVAALNQAGCATFFVADLSEARRLRRIAASATVYVLNGVTADTAPVFANLGLRPVIGNTAELREFADLTAAGGGGAALHVDTGMNRLGLTLEEAAQVAAQPDLSQTISLVMSHFACADEPGHPLNATQIAEFRAVRALFPMIPGSLANSSGIFLGPDTHHDLVRAGAALYGANPTPGHLNVMRPVITLAGRIIQVRTVPTGETVGYGAEWTAKRPTRIAVVGIGYADGFLRAAGASDIKAGAQAMVSGRRCPLAGRISMDLLMVDVTDLPEDGVRRGDLATFLNDEIGIDELASHARTIGYEVLTSLGRRYHRVYTGG